jgi:histidine ammonia-lyase
MSSGTNQPPDLHAVAPDASPDMPDTTLRTPTPDSTRPSEPAQARSDPQLAAVTIDGSINRAELYEIVAGRRAELGQDAAKGMATSHDTLLGLLDDDRHVYGASSGVGDLRDMQVTEETRTRLQLNIVRSHCCGVGPALPSDLVRAALALRAATFARGYSGVRPRLTEHMLDMLNASVHPVVPEYGSVGASGDPVLLAHLALGIVGEGEATIGAGPAMPTAQALAVSGLEPIALVPREGLALVNGLDFTIGAGALLSARAERLLGWADAIASLTLDVLHATADPFLFEVQHIRGGGRHVTVAARVTELRADPPEPSPVWTLQDPYCLRCIPQVHGASWTSVDRYAETVSRELGAVIDNPLIFVDQGAVRHCGHFHGQELALAADHLALALVNLANIGQARISLLLRGTRGLPRMLAPQPGASSGLMMIETTSASIVARMRALATPFSVHSLAASSEQEDHTSMSWEAVRRTDALLRPLAYVLAVEARAASTAARLRGRPSLGSGTRTLFDIIESLLGSNDDDRPLGGEIEFLTEMIFNRDFADPQ